MAEEKSFKIIVPATSANLGPGFDCMGITLDLWNECEFSFSSNKEIRVEIKGEGKGFLPEDQTNLIIQVIFSIAGHYSKKTPAGIHLHCRNNIPVGSGLGSSSAAIAAGLLCANHLFDLGLKSNDLVNIGSQFEGHADNLAACMSGGLTISAKDGDEFITQEIKINNFDVTIAVPEVDFSTKNARMILPENVPLDDAVFNTSHACLLLQGLQNGNRPLISSAMKDAIHQKHRLAHIPGAEEAIEAALRAGAYGACLSGAGPSVIAFADSLFSEVGSSMKNAFGAAGIPSKIIRTKISNRPAHLLMG